MQRRLPKYFVNRVGEPDQARQPQSPTHVVDCFHLSNSYTESQDWIVATDSLGNLQAWPDGKDGNRSHLPAQVQSELAWFEMAGHGKRQIEASEVFLFYLQVMEQLPEAPGLNDPVYLYGTLFGPYPAASQASSPMAGVEGQLTITRADLLEGVLLGAEFAFRFAGGVASPPRCFHLILPADGEDAIRQGQGIVIAYPLLPPELIVNDVTNELFTCRLIHDTLTELKEDALEEKISHPISDITLPVPSRALFEQQLQAEGYEIKDDKAVRKSNPANANNEPGFLANVLSNLLRESLKLPPEGSPEDFIELSRLTLRALRGWPTARAVALRNRIQRAAIRPANRAVSLPTAPPPSAQTPRRVKGQPPVWVKDFIDTHRHQNSPPPHLTSNLASNSASNLASNSANETNSSDWMKDFADDSIPSMNKNETNASTKSPTKPISSDQPDCQPDWMKDFD